MLQSICGTLRCLEDVPEAHVGGVEVGLGAGDLSGSPGRGRAASVALELRTPPERSQQVGVEGHVDPGVGATVEARQ